MSENDTLGFGGFAPPPGPPKPPKRHTVRNILIIAAGGLLGIIGAAVVITALAGSSHHARAAKAAPPSVTASATPPEPSPAQPPATTPDTSQDLTGPLGTTFTDTVTDNSTGAESKYDVIAVRVLDPAAGSDEFETADPGKRLIGVKFRITGDSGYSHENANNDAVILGDDGQVYDADFSSLAAGTNFSSGDFGVTAGQTQVGWVTFQLPRGVRVSSVQWQPDPFGEQPPATWTVSS